MAASAPLVASLPNFLTFEMARMSSPLREELLTEAMVFEEG